MATRWEWALLFGALGGFGCTTPGSKPEAVKAVRSALTQADAVTLTKATDITTRRTELINFVWGQDTLPTTKAVTEPTTEICEVQNLPNLASTTQLSVSMTDSQKAFACHLKPTQSNGRLVILHHGHGCRLSDGSNPYYDDNAHGMYRTAYQLLNDGFGVLFVYMPHFVPGDCGGKANSGSTDGSPDGDIVDPHPAMLSLTPPAGSSLQYFLTGTLAALNYVSSLSLYQDVNMIGLSGGGWTTSWYAALDTRIKQSFVMSGAMPFQMWPYDTKDEQTFAGYYDGRTGYKDLFLMGADGAGRRQIHVVRRNDNCCFDPSWNLADGSWSENVHGYEVEIRTALVNQASWGMFKVEIDETSQASHTISRAAATNVILSELEGARPRVGAIDDKRAFVRGAGGTLWCYSAGNWVDTGLKAVGVPAVIHVAGANQHSVDLFYRDPSNGLMHGYPLGNGWASEPLGGVIISDPAAVSRGPGIWDVVAFGGDYQPYWWSSEFQGYAGTIAGSGLGTPALVASSTSQNELHMFFRGLGDGVYTASWNGSAWSLDDSLQPAGILGFPAALRVSSSLRRVYVLGHDHNLYENSRFGAGAWTGWQVVQTPDGTSQLLAGSPSAASVTTVLAGRSLDDSSLIGLRYSGRGWKIADVGGGLTGLPTRVPKGSWAQSPNNSLWFTDGKTWTQLNGWFD